MAPLVRIPRRATPAVLGALRRPTAVAALVMLAVACTSAAGAVLEPQVWGWERFLKVDWTAVEQRGRIVLQGYVSSDSPNGLTSIRLLVESLDASGAVRAQRIVWVLGDLAPFSRTPFVAPVAERAPLYRVRVFAFDRIEAQSWGQ